MYEMGCDEASAGNVSPDRRLGRFGQRPRSATAAVIVALSVITIGCSGSDLPEGIQANDRGSVVEVPGELEGGPEPVPDGVADLPTPVEGLNMTPVVDFLSFDGTPGSTADFTGQPTVINFWQSYCPPCVAEMPDFEAAFQALHDNVSFVGMNVADTRAAANDLVAETGVTYPLADDPDYEVFRSFGGFVMPTTVLLNRQGQVAYVWSGVLTGDELRILIDRHILAA